MLLRFSLIVFAMLCPAALWSGPVVLTTLDGSLTIEGDLVSYDGELFRVETAFGALTVDGGNVTCAGTGCPDPDDILARAKIAGPADLLHGLLPSLLQVFAEREGLAYRSIFKSDAQISWELRTRDKHQLVAVFEGEVFEGASGVARLEAGEIDLAMGRSAAVAPVRQDVIALDALVPIVAPDNPRAMVTASQLRGLLSGSIGNWAQLDGPDLAVSLHLMAEETSMLGRLFPSRRFTDATRHGSAEALADAVAADPAALGLVRFSKIGNAVPLVISGACGLATPATPDTIRSKDYPVTQPLFLYRVGARQPKVVRDFIAYARSHEAQAAVRASGYVDQVIGEIAFERQGDRVANAVLAAGDDPDAMRAVTGMIGALMNLDRLTLTFRFEDGSTDLDPQSATNVLRLSDAIGRGEFDGRELAFVGFTDGVGPADGNQRLSERRARTVLRAVRARIDGAPVTLTAVGFGESMPMACDDTPWGKQVNRRVEVWVK